MSVKVAEAKEVYDLAIDVANLKQRMAKIESEFYNTQGHVPALHRRLTEVEISLEQISHGKKLPTGVIDWRMQKVEAELSRFRKMFDLEEQECVKEDVKKPVPSFLVYNPGARTGEKWTNAEERWVERTFKKDLVTWAQEECPPTLASLDVIKDNISIAIGRTCLAVECRLRQLGYDWV